MFVPDDKLKVNKFRIVAIPRPIEFMTRFGVANMPSSAFSGDELAPIPKDKVSMLADAELYDAMMQKVELEKQKQDES